MNNYQRIRDLREDNDLSQKKVAEMLKDTQQHYQLYESGKREPPFNFIIRLAKIYKVSIDYIAGLTNSKGGLHKNSEEEQKILSLYNGLSERRKGKVEYLLTQLNEEQQAEESQKKESV